MRVSTQLIAALALAAGTANASLYRRAHDASAVSAVSATSTETNTNTATITSPSATSTGGTHTMKHDHDSTTTETSSSAATTESHAPGAARPAQTSVSLIKGSAAVTSSAAASPSAAAAANSTAPVSRPKATGTGDYVGYVDHSAEPSSGSHKTGSASGSGSSSSSDEGEASPRPTKALHTSPGSNLVVPGLAALGSLAVGLMVLV